MMTDVERFLQCLDCEFMFEGCTDELVEQYGDNPDGSCRLRDILKVVDGKIDQ